MTWIRTIPLSEADEKLRNAMQGQMGLYPQEYATPVHPTEGGGAQIVESDVAGPVFSFVVRKG